MNCRECGGKHTVSSTVEPFLYTGVDFRPVISGITLEGAEVERCSQCGHETHVIPKIGPLLDLIENAWKTDTTPRHMTLRYTDRRWLEIR